MRKPSAAASIELITTDGKEVELTAPNQHAGGFFENLDAMVNTAANIGTSQDRRSYTQYTEKQYFPRVVLEAMYAENWIAGKAIDIVADDMTREWRDFTSSAEPAKIKEFQDAEVEFDIEAKFHEAEKWARLYGGCGIIIGLDEKYGDDPEEPLNIEMLGKDCLTHLTVIESERLTYAGHNIVLDPTSPYFDEPEFFRIAFSSQLIHRSRVLFFNGIKMPHYPARRQRLPFWGRSILQRIYEALVNADMTANGAATLVGESSNDVIKYKGLAALMLQPGGEEKIRKRFALMKLLKANNNATLLDEEESFETHSSTFSGLGDLLDRFLAIVSGATDIPVTRLIGTAAKGLNATGEGDLKNYYDNIAAQQKRKFNPNMRKIDRVIQRHLWGKELPDWSFTWNSLFQLSPKDQSEMESNNAFRDNIYLEMGVVRPSQIAKELQQNNTYSNITDADIKEIEEAEKKVADLEDEQLQNALDNPGTGEFTDEELLSKEQKEAQKKALESDRAGDLDNVSVGENTGGKPQEQ